MTFDAKAWICVFWPEYTPYAVQIRRPVTKAHKSVRRPTTAAISVTRTARRVMLWQHPLQKEAKQSGGEHCDRDEKRELIRTHSHSQQDRGS